MEEPGILLGRESQLVVLLERALVPAVQAGEVVEVVRPTHLACGT